MKPTYEELEKKCALQQSKLAAINELMGVVEKASDIAKAGIEELQSQNADLAVQLANAESKCRELAAENSGLKAAFDKPQAYLSWHAIPPTWEDPLPCGEYLDVHDETGHKNSDGTDCWPVFAKPEIETPATDTFLAEVRASELDSLAGVAETMLVKFANQNASEIPEAKGWEMIRRQASQRAAKIRQEAAQ